MTTAMRVQRINAQHAALLLALHSMLQSVDAQVLVVAADVDAAQRRAIHRELSLIRVMTADLQQPAVKLRGLPRSIYPQRQLKRIRHGAL